MQKQSLLRKHIVELLLIVAATVGLYFASAHLDLSESLDRLMVDNEHWEADEVFLATLLALVGAIFFGVRRLHDFRLELKKRQELERRLYLHRDELSRTVAERTAALEQANQNLRNSIAERERAWEHLQESERRYRELFELMQEGVGMVDENESIIFCNPAYATIFEEESAADMIGKNLKQYITPDRLEQIDTETRRRASGEFSTYETEIRTAKGRIKSILVSATPKFDENKNFLGTLGSVIDLTEVKKLQDLSMRAQRLEESGRIAGQVAHDFNNLLGPLVAYPDLIREIVSEADPIIPYLEEMQTSARQIAEINQQLLTLGRRAHYEQVIFNVNELIDHATKQARAIPEDITLTTDCDPELLNVYGGPSQIARVLANLMVNALDAMPDGGRLSISTENHYSEGIRTQYGNIGPGEYVRITISDTGAGMTRDVMAKMMDAFFSTKKASHRSGSGLGLSVVFAIVADHKGCIDVQSAPGQGTSFMIYLPASREVAEEEERTPLMRGTERILVIDDDPVQLNVAKSLLGMLGYSVAVAGNGQSGLEYLRNHSVDLVLVDMIMPSGLDGLDTVRSIVEVLPQQKIVVVSGYAESERLDKTLKLSGGTFISKPFSLQTISVAIHKALHGRKSIESPTGELR